MNNVPGCFQCLWLAWLLLSPWSAGAVNEVVFNLEPSKEYPRNSEGAFVTLKSGRILFVYTQFYGGARDESPARLAAIHSDDQGHTWSPQPRVIKENRGSANIMSVSLLRLKSGRIALLYLVKNNWLDCHGCVEFSDDEGETWSAPMRVTAPPGYFVVNNDRLIQLQTGRLVVPAAFHRARGTDPATSKSFDSRAIAMWFLSDDEGKTWREAGQWWAIPVAPSSSGLQEPGVVELADGSLFSWARTDQGAQYEFRSRDAGQTWSAPAPGELVSPVSPASIKRRPGSADLIAVWNDHSGVFPFAARKRTPLVIGVSTDSGKTWPARKPVETAADGWYCYTAMHFAGDFLLLGYCTGDAKVGGLNRLRLRRLSLDWLKENLTERTGVTPASSR